MDLNSAVIPGVVAIITMIIGKIVAPIILDLYRKKYGVSKPQKPDVIYDSKYRSKEESTTPKEESTTLENDYIDRINADIDNLEKIPIFSKKFEIEIDRLMVITKDPNTIIEESELINE